MGMCRAPHPLLSLGLVAVGVPGQPPLSPTNIFAPASTPAQSIFELSLFVWSTAAAIFLVVFSLLAYAVIRFRKKKDDDGTTKLIVTAYALAALLPQLLRRARTPQLPLRTAAAGLVVQAGGIALRAWSMHVLGRYYSRTLRTEDRHLVVEAGPYRWVRHPGYAGSLLTWTGFALTSRSLPVVALVGGLMGRAYQRRIRAEETLLRRDLNGYASYSGRTRKLIPFIW